MRVTDERLEEVIKMAVTHQEQNSVGYLIALDLQDARAEIARLKRPQEAISNEPRAPKEPEELLPDGTVVKVGRENVERVIEWSIPSDEYPHRYHVPGAFGLCVRRELTVVRYPTAAESAHYEDKRKERKEAARRFKELAELMISRGES